MKVLLSAIVLTVLVGGYWARSWLDREADARQAPPAGPARIVSMAPSLTETLFALGLGPQVVGVTRFCTYPPEVAQITQTGGLADPNIEAIIALRPTLVVMLPSHQCWGETFHALGIETLVVDHRTVDGILDSIDVIGRRCGAQPRAERLRAELRGRLAAVERKVAGRPRPRVLVAVDRPADAGGLRDVYAAGASPYYEAILALAGGRNALGGAAAPFPVVSTEGILKADPEVIVDLLPAAARSQIAERTADWRQVGRVAAVREGRVYVLAEDYALVPGPRVVLLVERLAKMFHPEVEWDNPSAQPAATP